MKSDLNEFDIRERDWDEQPDRIESAKAGRQVPFNPWMRALEYGCGTGQLIFFPVYFLPLSFHL
jgi:hypothetical protein